MLRSMYQTSLALLILFCPTVCVGQGIPAWFWDSSPAYEVPCCAGTFYSYPVAIEPTPQPIQVCPSVEIPFDLETKSFTGFPRGDYRAFTKNGEVWAIEIGNGDLYRFNEASKEWYKESEKNILNLKAKSSGTSTP